VGLAFVILRRAVKLSYFALLPILSGLQVLGGLLAYCSLLKPVFALPACFCRCAGWLLVLYEMFLALMLSRRFPLRFPPSVFILMIAIAVMATVGILDLVRENLRILYGIFLAVPIAFTVVWFSIQPYFLFLLEGSLGNEEPETRSDVRGPAREIRLFGTLTARERETAELMLQGFSYTEIAKKLNIAPSTVISHRKTLYGKLGIDSKRELFEWARGQAAYSM
jgi:DNA-binding CsgD family transcriptional regulator